MALPKVDIPEEQLQDFCARWNVLELALFGSVLRDDFSPLGDVDVLVPFQKDVHWGLADFVSMVDELGDIFGHKVDLIERRAIERSENYIRRRHILSTAEPVYVAG